MGKAGIALVACAVVGCADLPAIEPACGNGVLEPGEDCDTPSDRCVQCGWHCVNDQECVDIPAPRDGTQYRCGVDLTCHAPSGVLAPESSHEEFPAWRLYVTDVDRDHIGDAVGLGTSSIVTRFGDADGLMATERDLLTAAPTGEPLVADLDGDQRTDVILPNRDGIAAYASPASVISPFAFALSFGGVAITPRAVIPIDGKRVVVIADDVLRPGFIAGSIVDISASSLSLVSIQLCDPDFTAAGFEPDSLDYYDSTPPLGTKPTVAFTFIGKNMAGERELCGVSVVEDLQPPISYSSVRTTPIAAPTTRPVFATLDGSGCPSLVISDAGPTGLYRYTTQRNAEGHCVPGATAALPALPGAAGDVVVGRIRLDPPVANQPPDALVLSGGIYSIDAVTNAVTTLYTADRPFMQAASGDVNADGLSDGVAIGSTASVDVLYRTVAPDGFVRERIATRGTPKLLTIGDYDGNRAADIAYVVGALDGVAVQIAYGTRDHPLAPVDAATFRDVRSLVRIRLAGSGDPNGIIDGLGVVERRGSVTDPTSVVVGFLGSADRTLIPYFDPRANGVQSSFRAVIGGHFVATTQTFDMLALELPDPPQTTASLWRFAGDGNGTIAFPVPPVIASKTGAVHLGVLDTNGVAGDFGDCTQQPGSAFCVDGARFVTWSSPAGAQMLAFDTRHGRFAMIDPAAFDSAFALPAPAGVMTVATHPVMCTTDNNPCFPGAGVFDLFTADLDGDGTGELVMTFEGPGNGGPLAKLAICEVSPTTLTCSVVSTAGRPYHAAVTAMGVVASSGTMLERVVHGSAGYEVQPIFELPSSSSPVWITDFALADVTGDAIEDVLVLGQDADGVSRLHVFPQLTLREVGK